MDDLDFQILKHLNRNCRISYSKIAGSLGLSVRAISRRVAQLLEDNIILYFTINFNYERLGYRIYIGSLNPPNDKQDHNFFLELQDIPEIYQIWELLDGSLTFSFFCENSTHLESVLTKILEVGAELNNYVEPRSHLPIDYPFSNTDWRIIYYLMKNSRAPKQQIALDLGLNEKTISRRLKRMNTMKLVQFTPVLDWSNISGMVPGIISIEPIGPSKPIYQKIKFDASIKYWRNVGGVSPSIILFVYGKNLTEIREMCKKLQDRKDIKKCTLRFEIKFYENSSIIEDAILERI